MGDGMWLIKLPFKIVAIPLMIAVTLVQWVGVFLIGFSSVIFNLFAGLYFMLSICCYLMQISTGAETLRMLIMAFVVFLIPYIGEWIVAKVAMVNYGLRDFIMS